MFCTSIAANAKSEYNEKGYGMSLNVEGANFEAEPMVGFSTDQGYYFGNGVFAGINLGVHFNHIGAGQGNGIIVPVMAELKYHLFDSESSPFVSCGIGTAWMSGLGMTDYTSAVGLGVSKNF